MQRRFKGQRTLTAALVFLVLNATTKAAETLTEFDCAVMTEESGEIVSHKLTDLHVLDAVADSSQFTLPKDAPNAVKAVICGRSSIVPAISDYKVLASGYPFNIVSGQRIAALEVSGGQIRLRMIKGTIEANEMDLMQTRLNELQTAFDAAARSTN